MGLVLSVRWIVFAAQAIIIFPALKVAHNLEIKRREIETAKDEISKLEHLYIFEVFVAGFSQEFATPLSTLHIRLRRLNPELLNNDDLHEEFEAAKWRYLTSKNLRQRRNNLTESTFEKIDVGEKVREVAEIWRQSNAPLLKCIRWLKNST